MITPLRIVFMGTPEFAVPSLDRLYQGGFQIAGVVTAPDKPAGRGLHLTQSAVKKYALEKNLPVLQPEKLKDPSFIEALRSWQADLQVVVAFRMLPEAVWNLPPMGTINLHASLLPDYRGAAPINWVVINGEKVTGVTTFKLKHEIDTGNILMQEKVNIDERETAGDLHKKMMVIGADLLLKTVKELQQGTLQEIPQAQTGKNSDLHSAPKIFPEDCQIDWSETVEPIYNLIRGLSPYPGAFTWLNGKKLKIYQASREKGEVREEKGSYITDHKTYLKFAASDGYVLAEEIQLEGKKRMNVMEFLRGWRS